MCPSFYYYLTAWTQVHKKHFPAPCQYMSDCVWDLNLVTSQLLTLSYVYISSIKMMATTTGTRLLILIFLWINNNRTTVWFYLIISVFLLQYACTLWILQTLGLYGQWKGVTEAKSSNFIWIDNSMACLYILGTNEIKAVVIMYLTTTTVTCILWWGDLWLIVRLLFDFHIEHSHSFMVWT